MDAPERSSSWASQLARDDCAATREVLNRLGDRWSVVVIGVLGESSLRFGELKRRIDGISQRMLTVTVRGLERDGLLRRTAHSDAPTRVDYSLTPLGRTLLDAVTQLAEWALGHRDEIRAARDDFDKREAMTGDGHAKSA